MKTKSLMSLAVVLVMAAVVTTGCENKEKVKETSQSNFSTNITDENVLTDVVRRLTEEKNMSLVGAKVAYDEDNKVWNSKAMFLVENDNGNHGNFKNGYDFRYQAVYVDYSDSGKEDVWVLMNLDTGEIAEIYHEKKSGDTSLVYLKED